MKQNKSGMPSSKSGHAGTGSNHYQMPNRPREGGSTNKMPDSKSGHAGTGSNHYQMPNRPRG